MKKLCALAIPLVLAACSGRSDAEKAVRAAMKDPDSAKFGDFYYNSKTMRGCLTTNAKNSMGGYTGNSESMLTRDDEGWHYGGNLEASPNDCRKTFADVAEKAEPERIPEQIEAVADRPRDEADNASEHANKAVKSITEKRSSGISNRNLAKGTYTAHPTNLDPNGDNWVALRSDYGFRGHRLEKLGSEARFKVLGKREGWSKVILPNGRSGWILSNFVSQPDN